MRWPWGLEGSKRTPHARHPRGMKCLRSGVAAVFANSGL